MVYFYLSQQDLFRVFVVKMALCFQECGGGLALEL